MAAALRGARRRVRHAQSRIPEDLIRRVALRFWVLRGKPEKDEWRDWFSAEKALRERISADGVSAEEACRCISQVEGIPVYFTETNVLTHTSHGVAAAGGTIQQVKPQISKDGNGEPMSIGTRLKQLFGGILRPGGEATPMRSGMSLRERRNLKMLHLPSVPSEVVAAIGLVPTYLAFKLRVLPIAGHEPVRNDWHDDCGFARLLCEHVLSEVEREELCFTIPYFSFEYVQPGHPDFDRYRDLVQHLTDVLEYYCPPEEHAVL